MNMHTNVSHAQILRSELNTILGYAPSIRAVDTPEGKMALVELRSEPSHRDMARIPKKIDGMTVRWTVRGNRAR